MDLGDPRVPQFFWLDLPHSVWAKLRAMIQILEFPYLWRRSALCSFGRAGRNRPSSLAAVVRLRFVGSPAWLPRAVDKGQIADQQMCGEGWVFGALFANEIPPQIQLAA